MLPYMLPIPSFRHGWPNLKSICTPSPKLDSVIPEVVTYKQQSTCTVCQLPDVFLHMFACISFLVFLYFFTLLLAYFSPRLCTEHGSVMFELMAR